MKTAKTDFPTLLLVFVIGVMIGSLFSKYWLWIVLAVGVLFLLAFLIGGRSRGKRKKRR